METSNLMVDPDTCLDSPFLVGGSASQVVAVGFSLSNGLETFYRFGDGYSVHSDSITHTSKSTRVIRRVVSEVHQQTMLLFCAELLALVMATQTAEISIPKVRFRKTRQLLHRVSSSHIMFELILIHHCSILKFADYVGSDTLKNAHLSGEGSDDFKLLEQSSRHCERGKRSQAFWDGVLWSS
jgi:hypothetical protein